ncbi:hypothetical protein AGOR_G00097100 [Albula goreensis]|uniref:Uncharacterized protein n=1 Tax=Albula goreensis TaxID=1534307 RepID=A0A8T3DQY9_9TELE|nr:hypothetical protein AGOR_G00097100 [Albula goreensis]
MCVLHAVAVAVLSLLAMSTAAPSSCDDLLKPLVLNDIKPILGRWIFIQGRVDSSKFDFFIKIVTSSWAEFDFPHGDEMGFFNQGTMIRGTCVYSSTNVTNIANGTMQFSGENSSGNYSFLQTCPDCLVMLGSTLVEGESKPFRTLNIFGKTAKLSESDIELYKKQTECLGLPLSWVYDEEKEICAGKTKLSQREEAPEGMSEKDKTD